MNWVKTNWLIIVLSVVALAALPTMWFFSSKMSKTMRATVDKAVKADLTDVGDRASKVTYSVADVKKPDAKAFEVTTDVNEILTKKYAAARDAIKKESAEIGVEAVKFNEDGHKPLIEGLFPKPADADRNRAMYQFARAVIEQVPQKLLDGANAKGPVDAAALGMTLGDYKRAREERQKAVGAVWDQEEAMKLNQELLTLRMDKYRSWANQISFYADTTIFDDLPLTVPNPIPPMSRLWDWQLKVWIYQDVFKALALANSMAAGGGEGSVLTGPIKRISKITVDGPDYGDVPDELADAAASSDPSTVVATKDTVTPDQAVSITGRYSGPTSGNQYYDLRKVTLQAIVSPKNLPALFDALTQTNYMTVLRCDMEKLDPEADLKLGYYYGDDHVVKATIQIETIWLRAWTKNYMPKTVRTALSIPEDKPAGDQQPPQ
jgi:hypothetical protein